MTGARGPWFERPLVRTAAILALLAYLPALGAAPGRMPADSKLYLYLDPGRFFGDAAASFDGRQFAGWVPHQHIAYLWPSTPWFWVFDTLGVPDWVAHRLWIGTILLAAGLGVRWCARLLGLGPLAAFTAAVVYQVSPYVLPYVSRTSVMLLPWAGLGWIVAFTIRATRRHTWGDPAAVALVVLTVGAVNATALAMIVPAPVLWLVHARWRGSITTRQGLVVAARTGVLSLAVSLWWIAMLVIQGRFGTDVLPYSESLADVSRTATSAEAWRSLGYWLFYVRDPYAPTTTESLRYLSSSRAIVVSYLVPLMALAAVTWVGWVHRRFALLLIGTGLVLAVGVHPIDDRSPLMRLLAGDDTGGLALALRSSTRALPVMVLGVALAIATAVEAADGARVPRVGLPAAPVVAGVAVALAVFNLPSLWTGAFVDPALVRDEDPPDAWLDAVAALDAGDEGARVLQVPGAEFGAYRWGYTVDQPLPGLTDKPLVTRDLLPLGSAGAMDLLYALDDRMQDGVLEPASVAPVARMLGADTVWLTNDIAFDRFRTARPEVVRDLLDGAPGLGPLEGYGDLFLNRPDVPVTDERAVGDPRVGQPIVPVELAAVTDAPGVVRASGRTVLVSGSGDGLVDAAAAGLVDGTTTVVYSATADDLPQRPDGLIVTDSNRDRARHWRSSQDTTGFTEPGGERPALLGTVDADARLEVFDTTDAVTQTTAVQRGPVQATATSYGEPFAYLPEHRPFAAVDGDPDTAWIVGEHGDPIGETIRLDWSGSASELLVLQSWIPGDRRIGQVTITELDDDGSGDGRTVVLDDRSLVPPGQPIPISRPAGGTIEITIDAVVGGTPFTASIVTGVGFRELDLGLDPTVEVTRPPHDALDSWAADDPLALAFTRLRTDPMDRWRSDPEPTMLRSFDLPTDRSFDVSATVRVDARSSDAELAAAFGWPAFASTRLTGSPRHAGVSAIDGDADTAWITAFGEARDAVLTIDGVEGPLDTIAVRQPVAGFSAVTAVTVRSGGDERLVELRPDASGNAVGDIDPPLPGGDVEVALSDVEPATTVDRRFGDPVTLPAAISEIELSGLPPAIPVADGTTTFECVPVAGVDGSELRATVEVSGGAWLDGAALDVRMCDSTADLAAGRHVVDTSDDIPTVLHLDRLVFDDGIAAGDDGDSGGRAETAATVTDDERFARTVEVTGCTDGCWLVLGEGFNEAWRADDGALGAPTLVDGGFNGWWLPPDRVDADGTAIVRIEWTAQRPLTAMLVLSLLAASIAIALVVVDRVRAVPRVEERTWRARFVPPTLTLTHPVPRRRAVSVAVVWTVLAGLLIGPLWMVWGAIAGAVVVVTRRARLAELTAWATMAVLAGAVVLRERRLAPAPDGGWPSRFESLHGLGMFAVVAVLVAAWAARDTRPVVTNVGDDPGPPDPGLEP